MMKRTTRSMNIEGSGNFIDPAGFQRHFFKDGGWISYAQDFVFSVTMNCQRESLFDDVEFNDEPPAKKRRGRLPIIISKWAAEIVVNCRRAGGLGLKPGSQLEAQWNLPMRTCSFNGTHYVVCSSGFECHLIAEDDDTPKSAELTDDRMMIAVVELAQIRGRIYIILPKQESLVGSSVDNNVDESLHGSIIDQHESRRDEEEDFAANPTDAAPSPGHESHMMQCKPAKYWRKFAKDDNIVQQYLDELNLWILIHLYRPHWNNFVMPPPPKGYSRLPTADSPHEFNDVPLEEDTPRHKRNVHKRIRHFLKKLPHRREEIFPKNSAQ